MTLEELTRQLAEAKRELRRSNERLEVVLANSAVIFFELDLDGNFTRYEGMGLAAVRRPQGFRIGQSVFAIVPELGDLVRRCYASETIRWSGDIRGEALDAVLTPIHEEGVIVGASCVVTNVSAQRRAENARRVTEERFRNLFEKTSESIALVAADGVITYSSPTTLNGMTAAELVGTNALDWILPEDQPGVANTIERLLADPTLTIRAEVRVRAADGSIRFVEVVCTNMLGEPSVAAIVAASHDITAQKRVEAERRVSEERYRRIVEATSEGVVITNTAGIITFDNGRFAAMLGYGSVVGRAILDFAHPDKRMSFVAGPAYQIRLQHHSGREVWVEVQSHAISDVHGKPEGAIALISDHTARRRAEEANQWLAAIVESSDDAILGLTLDGVITTWNRGAQALYGHAAEEMVGRRVTVLLPPSLVGEETAILGRIVRGETLRHYETTRTRKDGSTVDVALTVSPIRDSAGTVVGASKIARDLTERRRTETRLQRTEDQLRQAQKLEAVGSLAGGIAHDFNNLLSVILSYTSLALDDLQANDPLREDLEQIEQASQRAASLTRQLLAFSRRQILEPQVIDLNQSVVGLEKILRRVLGEHIELSLLLDPAVGRIYADLGQLEQVIMNLVVNAHDAMPEGGKLTISTSPAVLEESHHGVAPGMYAMLAVTDTGIGMDAATAARIFEPFFTTKERGKGTGLGLSTVFGIVNQSGGHIWVYSEPKMGTTFKVYLPHSDRVGPSATAVAPLARAILPGHETILLVEDEDAVRGTMRTILRRQGYHVLEAENGAEALTVCEQYRTQIHLLLTDVVMPRMNGRQLAARILALRPDIKVLYVSGYTEDTIVHHGILDAGIAFLQKPITPSALERKVRDVLDGV